MPNRARIVLWISGEVSPVESEPQIRGLNRQWKLSFRPEDGDGDVGADIPSLYTESVSSTAAEKGLFVKRCHGVQRCFVDLV